MNWQDYQPGRRVVSLIDWRTHLGRIPQSVCDISTLSLPTKGEICTIVDCKVGQAKGNLVLFVQEHPPLRAVVFDGQALRKVMLGFDAQYFRPLDESRLDQFRVHLNSAPADCPVAPLVSVPA